MSEQTKPHTMFSACFISHAYPPSLSHRPRSRCPLLSASLSASGGKRAALAWRDRQMKENKWRQRVMKQGAKWRRRERYEDRRIYRERESKKKREIFFPLMSLLAVHHGSSSLLLESRETRPNVLHVHSPHPLSFSHSAKLSHIISILPFTCVQM